MNVTFEPLAEQHREPVIAIFNHYVQNSLAAYLEQCVPAGFYDLFLKMTEGYPAYAVRNGSGEVIGFGMLRPYSPLPTFAHTAEISYFLHQDYCGCGVGSALLARLLDEAPGKSITTIMASVAAPNQASIGFHRKHGFTECGRFRSVCRKQGKEIDVVWMQKQLMGSCTSDTDRKLAERYGGYASFHLPGDQPVTKTHGESVSDNMDCLLDRFATEGTRVLDLGCGAGQTLCRLAPLVTEIWGIDCEEPLLIGAQERVAACGLTNATLILGDTTDARTVAQLPDKHFDFAFSRRGPFLTPALMAKLKPGAYFVIEHVENFAGLAELFGRRPLLASDSYRDANGCVNHHAELGMEPVSMKRYFVEKYYRDIEHLEADLSRSEAMLSNWWMPPCPYDPTRDRAALELFARYNTTPYGIRLLCQSSVSLLRRCETDYYPCEGPRDREQN